MTERFAIEPLTAAHDRLSFSCGVDTLDRYLQTQAGQDMRRRVSNCFVALPEGTTTIAGYFTLAAASIHVGDLAEADTRKLPRYPLLPAVLVGRLAVDNRFKGQGLGAALLADAVKRAARADPAVFALVVDAKDHRAAAFYEHFGFMAFASRPRSYYLAMRTALRALGR